MSQSTVSDSDDNIYYNITIKKDDTNQGRADFSENRVEPIVDNPSDYELAVVRFSVPATDIPIMYFDSESGQQDKDFKVSMTFDGVTETRDLIWIPNHINPNEKKAIWNYQEMLDMINVALLDCFTPLKAAKPLAPPTEAPYLTYDAVSELITLNAEQLYNTNGPPTIKIFFNLQLFELMPSFQSFEQEELAPLSHQLLVKDNKNNSATIGGKPYFKMVQEYVTLALWNDLQGIVFASDSLPVENELQPSQTNVVRRIITDFEPLSDINNRQSFQYYPQGPLRFYDLKSNYPLSQVDVKVFWETALGTLYPIYIEDFQSLTIKILFRKKLGLQIQESVRENKEFE